METEKTDKKKKSINLDVSKLISRKPPGLDSELGCFGDRLRKAIGNLSARKFALESGISITAFHQYLTGKSEPTRPVIFAIANKAGVNIEWLVSGTGPMLKSDLNLPAAIDSSLATPTAQPFSITNLEGQQVQYSPSPDLVHIPVLSLEAACGVGTFADENHITAMFSATREWLILNLRRNPDNLCLIRARGDSMSDTIKPDDMVFVDPAEAKEPTDGIWVFRYEDSLFIKRLQFLPGKKIKVASDNPLYETYTLTPDDSFRLLARYIAVLNIKI